MTQYDRIIKLLKERGDLGINSYDRWSIAYQLPARIYYLARPPYNLNIEHKRESNGSVTYILHENKPEPVYRWDFEGSMAKQVPVNQKPVQEALI